MNANSSTIFFDINIVGVNSLKLVVNDGGNGVSQDIASWANPLLFQCISNPTVPSFPNDLIVNDLGGSYQLTWNHTGGLPTDEIIYEIFKDDALIGTTTSTSFNLGALTTGVNLFRLQVSNKYQNRSVSFWVEITYDPCPNNAQITNQIDNNTNFKKQVSNYIEGSSQILNSKVTFQAEKYIVLKPGFSTDNQTIFKAEIKGCD